MIYDSSGEWNECIKEADIRAVTEINLFHSKIHLISKKNMLRGREVMF